LKQSEKNYKRIVVKIGSSLFCRANNTVDFSVFKNISRQVAYLVEAGREVVIVSSGAIALGMHLLRLKQRPKELKYQQAAAAVGQHFLMSQYRNLFDKNGLTCAQILLTYDDFDNRERCLNAKNTLITLLRMGVVPIVNENDTISTDEIKFGDNDTLSGRVAAFIDADLLIILSDVDGLLDRDKKVVRVVEAITPQIRSLASPTGKQACVGGMVTKLDAAKIAVDSGIPCVIANGLKLGEGIIKSVISEPQRHGTLFVSRKGLDAKKRWLAFGTKPKGNIIIDKGAQLALINKKSLLSVGVLSVEGSFEAGDVVSVTSSSADDIEIARGKVGISSRQLDKIKGTRYDKEVIHRDNIVILQ